MQNQKWTREQTIVVLSLYCRIPFTRASSTHPDIIDTAKIIGRSPNSVKMKIGNFGSFDEHLRERGIVGLANASKLDKQIWDEFNSDWEMLAIESETIISRFKNSSINEIHLPDKLPEGFDRETFVKTRVNQKFFRNTILSSYNFRCCITGIGNTELLISSHIVPWSVDVKNRVNPRNGLCLNALHDKAFDKGLITVTPEYKIKNSHSLKKNRESREYQDFFLRFENQVIMLPEKFLPDRKFLEYHNDQVFRA